GRRLPARHATSGRMAGGRSRDAGRVRHRPDRENDFGAMPPEDRGDRACDVSTRFVKRLVLADRAGYANFRDMDRIGKTGALRPAITVAAALAALALCMAAKVELPDKAPLPAARPQPPSRPPVPSPRPRQPEPSSPETAAPEVSETPPVAGAMPVGERACRARLRDLGVDFEERDRLADPESGCLVAYPLAITSLGPAISLAPEAVMNCAMAEAAARFALGTISAEAERAFGSPL